jgi:hypothetical protein
LFRDANLSSYDLGLKKNGTAKIHLDKNDGTSKIHHRYLYVHEN